MMGNVVLLPVEIRTVRCGSCGSTRIGRRVDGETEAVQARCPDCGSTDSHDVVD